MRQVLIDGIWLSPPTGINIGEWLNEVISVELDGELMPKRWIRRFELIRAIRKSPRHKPETVKIVKSL